jgi:hypothetical protein
MAQRVIEMRSEQMVTHFSKINRKNAFGGTTFGTLCNRMNAGSKDGMNCTEKREEVTCKFCLKIMERRGL